MLDEVIKQLNIKKNGVYLDLTFGRGGHSLAILKMLGKKGKLIAFDKDLEAIEYANNNFNYPNLEVIHSSFAKVDKEINKRSLKGKVNGVLMDLGVSSPQLDNDSRGFSFQKDGPLDMRMDQSQKFNLIDWLKTATKEQIQDVIYKFGEERKSRKIAQAIKSYQKTNTITTTKQLVNIITSIIPNTKGKHPATRTFQAFRIFINKELDELKQALAKTIDILAPKGRLVVISFHSLEDRIVKKFIEHNSKGEEIPKGLPLIESKRKGVNMKKKSKFTPSKKEVELNNRARSAILRVSEKL